MKRFRVLHKISFVLLFLLLMFGISIYAYVPRIIAEVKNPVASLFNKGLMDEQAPDFGRYHLQGARTWRIPVNDSIRLSLYEVPARGRPKGTVLALHGYRSNKNRFLPVARYFTEHGWRFIAVDLRAHNQSSGTWSGFSYYERDDIRHLIDSLEARGLIRPPLVLYGHSIGAATAVYVAASKPEVRGLILESCFDDFGSLLPNYWEFYVTGQAEMPAEMAQNFFREMHIPIDSIRPVAVALQVHVPVLQIQGLADQKVRPTQAQRLFDAFGTNRKQWMGIPGGTHNRLWLPDTTAYFNQVLGFLDTLSTVGTARSPDPAPRNIR